MKRYTKLIALVLIALLLLYSLAGCGSQKTQEPAETDDGEETQQTVEPREVIVTVIGMIPGWQFEDESGELTGFEIELLKAIDELLPEYTFTFEFSDFSDMLIAGENGKADISACQWQANDERIDRFNFTYAYQKSEQIIVVDSANTAVAESIETIDDLVGLTVRVPDGNSAYYALTAYNEAHPDAPIDLDVASAAGDVIVADFKSGIIDAYVIDQQTMEQINDSYDIELIRVGEPVTRELGRFAINLQETDLLDAVNGALSQLRADGTISKLSTQFIGYDLSEGITDAD